MPTFNHLMTVAFSVLSSDPNGLDVTPAMLCNALIERIRNLNRSTGGAEWLEAVEGPCDSFEDVDAKACPAYSATSNGGG